MTEPQASAPLSPLPIPSDIHMEDIRLRSGPPGVRSAESSRTSPKHAPQLHPGRPRCPLPATATQQTGDSQTRQNPLVAVSLYMPASATSKTPLLPGLVVAHGAGSNRVRHRSFCIEACRDGFLVACLDFRGHGDSTGFVDGPLEEDVWAAVGLLRSHPFVDATRICYRGSSMGGYYGIRSAPEAGFTALALLCPANESVLLGALERKPEWSSSDDQGLAARVDDDRLRQYLLRHDTLRTAERIDTPCLIVHARGDEKVPFEHSLDLAAALAGEADLLLLPEGDHRSAQSSAQMHRRVAAWLAEKARAA